MEEQQQQQLKKPEVVDKKIPDVINKSDLTEDTVDVLEYFGLDAPSLLNNYSTSLEDALIEQVRKTKTLRQHYDDIYVRYRELEIENIKMRRALSAIQDLNKRHKFEEIEEMLDNG